MITPQTKLHLKLVGLVSSHLKMDMVSIMAAGEQRGLSLNISARRKLINLVMESFIAGVGVVKTVHWKVMMTPPGQLMRLSLSQLTMNLTVISI